MRYILRDQALNRTSGSPERVEGAVQENKGIMHTEKYAHTFKHCNNIGDYNRSYKLNVKFA